MTRSLAPILAPILGALVLAASIMPALAGAPGGTPYGAPSIGQQVTPRNYTLTPQAGQPLGNFIYLGNGMTVPRSMAYFFTWQGRPCQTLTGTTFCQ